MDDPHISKPFRFPNGATIRNRLVKSAMAEGYMIPDLLPNDSYIRNYSRWARPGVFLVNNPAVSYEAQLERLRSFTTANGSKIIGQLCHLGRVVLILPGPGWCSKKNIAPSPLRMPIGEGLPNRGLAALLFGTPREMTRADIEDVVDKFARAAKTMADAGFDGVELYGAHGFLLSQFLSRTDDYGGSAINRTRFVTQVIKALNSTDYQTDQSAPALQEVNQQFAAIAVVGVDFLEVSGGTYADPRMARGPPKATRTQAREAFFLNFAKTLRASFPDVPLMATGGLCSRGGMEEVVAGGGADLVGIGRASILSPLLPVDVVLNRDVKDTDARVAILKSKVPWYLNFGPAMADKQGRRIGPGTRADHIEGQMQD
ncbi:uncharacterized protein B0I36DRAFT_378557 [Microdochium trichocladiopsis]|uniref:NADH:flavin oxidoreductase/NADH oxidase N-terminal domain-containing protein n=1 Tax=Microdochium trichocladiopsis TaxID=1682393 RepID=A0A9P8XPY8_9PEZI|nr:uncharacterized protein B0I36DRAFT_378557 [Microdochium trichocladiopsis]KAH7010675.1 hypothetical protein B0I36DRAFT_378557 [Microdochium trichocladiopsis]